MELPLTTEEKLLCHILQDPLCASEAFNRLDASYFDPPYRLLFRVTKDYFDQYGKILDQHILFEYMRHATSDQDKENYNHAITLFKSYIETNRIESSDHFQFYLDAILKKKKKMVLSDSVKKINSLLIDRQEKKAPLNYDDIESVFNYTLTELNEIKYGKSENTFDISEYARDAFKEYEKEESNPEINRQLSLGIKDIDLLAGSMLYSTVMIIGGYPGSGKSALALNIGVNVWKRSKRVLYLSLEMPRKQVQNRLYACVSGLPTKRIAEKSLSAKEKELYKDFLYNISDSGLRILDPERSITMKDVELYFKKYGKQAPIDLVIIDDMPHLKPSYKKSFNADHEYMASISDEISEFAKTYKVAVIALVQLKRSGDRRKDDLYSLEMIGRTSRIAENANIILQIGKPSIESRSDQMQVRITKNRDGDPGSTFNLYQDLSRMYIGDMPSNTASSPAEHIENILSLPQETINNVVDSAEEFLVDEDDDPTL
jgi:replicative DNA helicase